MSAQGATIRFAKMHGLGNDFMVLDLVSQALTLEPRLIQCWSDRHTGVGFDQLLVIEPPSDPDVDFRYRIFNADGSEAEQCGNGARCIAQYALHTGLTVKSVLCFQTANGHITTRVGDGGLVEVDMGVPGLTDSQIPCDPTQAVSTATIGQAGGYRLATADGAEFDLVPVSMGNPHGVMFVDEIATAPVAEVDPGEGGRAQDAESSWSTTWKPSPSAGSHSLKPNPCPRT